MYKTYYNSPLGKLLIVSDKEKLIGLWIEGQKYYLGNLEDNILEDSNLDIFVKTKKWLDKYFNKEKVDIKNIPLAPIGSEFRKNVWNILCQIPYGKTTTYGNIAKEVAKTMNKNKMSAQAIGNAVGHNPISIIIPCHRVIGADGSLTGYAGGIDKKIQLLKLEGADLSGLYIPKNG